MVDKQKLFSRVHGEKRAEDVLHSSGFAQVQNGGSIGVASDESFDARQAINEHRRFVKGYQNARLVRSAYTAERARTYVPRTNTGEKGFGRQADTSGDGFSGSMRNGCRRADKPAQAKPAAAPAAAPKNPALRPDFKPKFR